MTEHVDEAVVVQASQAVATLEDDMLLDIAREAEARVEAVNKIKQLVLRVTNTNDWVDEDGGPYLVGAGAQKVARLFGLSWTIDAPQKFPENDGHYRWEYVGQFSMRGVSIEVLGTRSSADPFFSRSHGHDIPANEIHEGNVKKAAYTNCINNGIQGLLGIKNLTWKELKAGGIGQESAGRVDRKDGAAQAAKAAGTISEPQQKRLWAIAHVRAKDIDLTAEEIVSWVLTEAGLAKTSEVTKDAYEAVCEAVGKATSEHILGGGADA